jgi:hypothetical protein
MSRIATTPTSSLRVECPVCGARPAEVCTDPTPEQRSGGLPVDERWAGRNRKRSHASRAQLAEEETR